MQLHYTPVLRTAALISDYGWTLPLIEKHLQSLSTSGAGLFDERDVIRAMHSEVFADDLIIEAMQDKRRNEEKVRRDLGKLRRHALAEQHALWFESLYEF